MKETFEHEELLRKWSTYRGNAPADTAEFTSKVMDRIAAEQPETQASVRATPRLKRLALTTACVLTGVGKTILLLRLSLGN